MDPEDVRSLVDGCMARMGTIVGDFGGSVDKVVGDELMAVFGAPVSHGDDSERAVRAALEMHCCASEHTEEFGALQLRIGVNTGEVMFAPVGPEGARRFTVMGDVVNVASRLCQTVSPGGTLVGEATWRSTRHLIAYAPVDPLQVKGKREPLTAWLAVEPVAGPAERLVSTTPLVGRDREMGVLRSIWERVVVERKPNLITVVGSPGIGKTRLAQEFAALVEAGGGRVLKGRSLPYGERTGYRAFAQLVKQAAEIYDTDTAPMAREKLDRLVGKLFPVDQSADVASRLAVLIGLGTGSADKGPLFASARRFVEAIAGQRPTVLHLEDLHWSDPSLLDLVEFLAGRCRGAPVLILAMARPELLTIRPGWGGGLTSASMLELEPLSLPDSKQLLTLLMLKSEPSITERLVDTAGGNPLFIEELVASCTEQTADLAAELPPTVQAIIAARLDALPPDERQVLFDAAVVGKIFWRGILARLGSEDGLDEVIDSLETRDLIRPEPASTLEGDRQFAFKHMLIREVAYATLPKAARRERHAAVARFLAEAAGDRIEESASLLAHHWREADDKQRAVRYLLVAAEQARRSWAKTEAVSLYSQALELIPDGDRAAAATVRLGRATALVEGADFQAAATELDALLPELEGRQRTEALVLRVRTAIYLADADTLAASAREAMALSEVIGDPGLRARGLAVASAALASEGSPVEAITVGDAALEAWPAGSYQTERAAHSAFMCSFLYWVGSYERAVEQAEETYQLGMETHGVEAILLGGGNLGMALTGMGRHEKALSLLERVVAQGTELELLPRMTARATNIWAGAMREIPQLERVRDLNQEALELAQRAGFPYADVQARIDLLFVDLEEGGVGAAERDWPALWEAALASKGFHRWLMGGRLMTAQAQIALAAGRTEAAATTATAPLATAKRNGRLKYEVASHILLGSALAEMGRADQAVAELREALRAAERLGHPPSRWRAAFALARTLVKVADDDGAAAAARTATATVRDFAGTLKHDHRAHFLAAPSVTEILRLPS